MVSGPEILDHDSLSHLFATVGAADITGALALGYAAEELRADRGVVMEAVKQDSPME